MSEEWESTRVYGQVLEEYLRMKRIALCCVTVLNSLECFLTLAALHFSFTWTHSDRALSPSVCLYMYLSYKNTHLCVHKQMCSGSPVGGCVWKAEYVIAQLYHHYCSFWVSASLIKTGRSELLAGRELSCQPSVKRNNSADTFSLSAAKNACKTFMFGSVFMCVTMCETVPLEDAVEATRVR